MLVDVTGMRALHVIVGAATAAPRPRGHPIRNDSALISRPTSP
jgi:hypothetical protein